MNLICAFFVSTVSLSGWRGETVSFQTERRNDGPAARTCRPAFSDVPSGWTVRAGVQRGVRYATEPFGSEYRVAPDRVAWNGSTNLLPGASFRTAASVVIPADAEPGDYAMSFDGEPVSVHVSRHVLPPPAKWKYWMNMWHNPFSLARLTGTELWSDAHFEAMRPFMAFTAAWGQKGICTSISDYPWNHQCYDGYRTMIRHIKNPKTKKWTFDYAVFDRWVQFNFDTANGAVIQCYSLCPWDYSVYWEDTTGHPYRIAPKPGTPEFEAYWTPFLRDFVRHLREKGWLEKVRLSFDERNAEDMKKIVAYLERVAPEFGVADASNEKADKHKDVKAKDFCIYFEHIDRKFLDECHARRAKGLRTGTCYVCCGPKKPNNFFWSDPDDNFWIQVFPIAHGMKGSERWTIDSWPKDPMNDATYYVWPSGDSYFIYPDASPSIRYLLILNGVQNGEKWRILYDELGEKKAALDALAEKYDPMAALKKKDGDFRAVVEETLRLLNYEADARPAQP